MSIPVWCSGHTRLAFIENREEKDRQIGADPGPALKSWVERLFKEVRVVHE